PFGRPELATERRQRRNIQLDSGSPAGDAGVHTALRSGDSHPGRGLSDVDQHRRRIAGRAGGRYAGAGGIPCGGSRRDVAVLHQVIVSPARTANGLPVTAFLVLGVLAANDEQLTAGEIKMRAELSVGHFYWSPSVSHVRRELTRLLARGMVSETGAQSGKRAITLYQTTEAGLDALRRWVQH